MSKKHPIVAVTGSSGAGTTTVKRAFEHIFLREGINSAVVEGDSFHRYDRAEMREAMAKAAESGRNLSHFGPEANRFNKLAELFDSYGKTGTGEKRYYLHSPEEAEHHNARLNTNLGPGQFTPWENIPEGTDLLFYEGLHGLAVTDEDNVAEHVDLGIGVVPIVPETASVAEMECPPSEKKSSKTPTRSRARTSWKILTTVLSTSLRGAT